MWLPPNATSVYQPLDQGIIQNWKAHVKKQFVSFMAKTFDDGKDLSKEMHVLRAIRWGISCWENDVTKETIQKCWIRSQCLGKRECLTAIPPVSTNIWTETEEVVDEVRQGLIRLRDQGVIAEIPNIHNYISPYSGPWNERVEDEDTSPENLVDEIAARYAPEDEGDDDEPLALHPQIGHQAALIALNTLRQYEEQNAYSAGVLLRYLRTYEREIFAKTRESQKQVTLDRWTIGVRGELG